MEQVKKNILAYKELRGVSWKALGKIVNYSQHTLRKDFWCNAAPLTEKKIEMYAKALNISVATLKSDKKIPKELPYDANDIFPKQRYYIGRGIRRQRLFMELSQKNIAKEIGIGISYFGQIERNEIPAHGYQLLPLVKALGITIERLFEINEGRDKNEKHI